MPAAALPRDESARLQALSELDVLDSAPEPEFDALVRAAAAVCGAPMAVIGLVDAQRVWLKARLGLPGPREVPREVAPCAHVILQDGLCEVADAWLDPRFADSPLVTGEPHIRFYAGWPLCLADGARVGTLCVMDHRPRRLDAMQREVLAQLSTAAVRALEGRRALRAERRLREQAMHAAAVLHNSLDAIVSLRLDGTVTHWNTAAARLFGHELAQMCGQPIARIVPPGREHEHRDLAALLARHPEGVRYDTERLHRDGQAIAVSVSLAPIVAADGRLAGATKIIRDIREQVRAAQELQDERRRLAWLIEATGAGTWEWNVQTQENRVNERWAGMLGWTLQELGPVTLQTWHELAHPEDAQRAVAQLQRYFDGETALYECEARLRHRDGHWVWVYDSGRVMTRTADGAPQWMFGMQVDITERKRQEEALRRNEAFLQRIGELAGVAGWELRLDTGALHRSPQLLQLDGQTHDRRPTLDQALQVYAAEARPQMRAAVERAIAGGTGWDMELPLATTEGPPRWLRSVGQVEFEDGRPVRLVGAVQDVTEQRRIAAELRHRATHDALTGLVNRAEFEARLHRLLERAHAECSQHALLYIDLDQFKLVNDACGHAAGDRLLQQVAQLLGQTGRARDTLARLGGDEFAVLLEHCCIEPAQRVAQEICHRMDDYRFVCEGQRFRIGASIGLVPLDNRWITPAAVMQAADTACYAAKENGRNRVHLWLDSDETLRARHGEMQLAARLEQALDENRLVLWAQRIEPLAAPHGGGGLHAELLVRLRERDGSLLLPGAFLPAAERFHLASRIDRWVLAHALALLRELPQLSGIALLSINLSGQSIGDQAFHRDAMALLEAAGAALCGRLCLEITETAAVTNMSEAARFIAQARALGLRVALDDFGAGASSFGYLKSLSIDLLKIDGQFVRRMVEDPLDDVAVRCFQDVASVMGVHTVAEFVDRPAVLARLQEIGVHYAQGFLLHRPEPARELLHAVVQRLQGAARP